MKNKQFSKGVWDFTDDDYSIILGGDVFKTLKVQHRPLLWEKLNQFIQPNKSNTRYKQWFLYPSQIPKNNHQFYISVMSHTLLETLNDGQCLIIEDLSNLKLRQTKLQEKQAKNLEISLNYEQILKKYGIENNRTENKRISNT